MNDVQRIRAYYKDDFGYEHSALTAHDPDGDFVDYDYHLAATNEFRENIATMAQERDKLEAALRGLLARHKDGSDEQHWAEWDTAEEALNGIQRLAGAVEG